jgi:hypothetical protein
MNREFAFRNAPRCAATSKRTRERCKAPAMRGRAVCRFHGARGGAPKGARNGNYRHGLYTKDTIEEYRRLLELLRPAGAAVAGLQEPEKMNLKNEPEK